MKSIIKFKEVGSDHIGTTSYIGENLTKDDMIKFFGLDGDNVEMYDIELVD